MTMKDYYKILGVKEGASEEEIRARWVELTKQYHPDRGEGPSSDERIREINEAYQVLKHSSTRAEYDLKRTYGQEKTKSYAKRVGIPAGILIIATIVGIIYYFMNFQNGTNGTDQTVTSPHPRVPASTQSAPLSSKSIAPNKIASIDQTNQTNQKDQIDERNQTNEIDQTNQTDQRNQISASTHPRVDATRPPIAASTQSAPLSSKPIAPNKIASVDQTNQINQKDQIDQRNKTDQRNQISVPTPPHITASTRDLKETADLPIPAATVSAARNAALAAPQPRQRQDSADAADTRPQRPKDTGDAIDSKAPRSDGAIGFGAPSVLATEDEVKKFFNDYVERYNRMDLEGLFSLFSPDAVQNKKDRLEGIRKIYADFFNRGQEVRYRVQDMKIEIYQNAVEVRARYEIDQGLKIGGRMVWKGNIHWVLGKENGIFKILSLDYQHQQVY